VASPSTPATIIFGVENRVYRLVVCSVLETAPILELCRVKRRDHPQHLVAFEVDAFARRHAPRPRIWRQRELANVNDWLMTVQEESIKCLMKTRKE
jgi:hypothetical protein